MERDGPANRRHTYLMKVSLRPTRHELPSWGVPIDEIIENSEILELVLYGNLPRVK